MGYSGAKLASLFTPALSRTAARRMAERGAEEFRSNVVKNTPINDHPHPSRPPGTARASWKTKTVVGPIRSVSREIYETGVESDDDVTVFLEYGTGLYGPKGQKYWIFPKDPDGHLSFYDRETGDWVHAKAVHHPGIHAQRPLAIGAAITEHELRETLLPTLEQWKREQEAYARRPF